MADCHVCGKVAEPAYSITFSGCPHTVHGDCCGEMPNLSKCPVCAGVGTSIRTSEPHTDDGIDYVYNPGSKTAPGGMFNKVASIFKKQPAPTKPSENVEMLLKKRVPIATIIRRHKLGLDHALRDGVMIEDYLVNGYKLKDLAEYEYISQQGPRRALVVLTTGLGLCANHLRDYPHLIPMKDLRNITELETSEVCTVLGLEFPEGESLQCFGDKNWGAKDCINLGLKLSDLIDFGLQYTVQYKDLMHGMSNSEIVKAETELSATEDQIAGLVDLEALQEEEELRQRREIIATKQSRIKQAAQPPPPPSSSSSSEEQEEEEEEDESEEEVVPTPKKPVAKKVAAAVPARKKPLYTAPIRPSAQLARHGFIDNPKRK